MSISGISSLNNLLLHGMQSSKKKNTEADMRALNDALQSNDLAGAQKAFVALQSDMQSQASVDPKGNNSDLTLIGKLLATGNGGGMSNLFSILQEDASSPPGFAQNASTDATQGLMEKLLRSYAKTGNETQKAISQGQLSIKA